MQYALLAYGRGQRSEGISATLAAVLDGPPVTGWLRLHADESATTLTQQDERILITDGPFVESKEYLAGIILIDADNLDEALAVARRLQETRTGGAIEIRPVLGSEFRGA